LLLPPTNALMRSRKRKAPAATAESAPCSTSHWALPNDGNEEYTFKLFFRRRPPERRCCWYCNLLSLKLLTLFSESLLWKLPFWEEKEHDAVRCEFERCKHRVVGVVDSDEELFFLLRFFAGLKRATTDDATGTPHKDSIICAHKYLLRADSFF
jgi:hypothetical protein